MAEGARKAVHIGAGFAALLLRWLPAWGAWVLAGVAIIGNVFLLPRLTGHALERPAERRSGTAWGIVFYPIMVLLLCVVFRNRLEIAAVGWGVMAFGDGPATLFGRRFRSPKVPWNRDKSLWGTLSFVVIGALASWGIYLFVAAGHGRFPDPVAALLAVSAATAVAAIFESIPSGIDDNLTVPVVASVFMYGFTLVDPAQLTSPELGRNFLAGLVANLLVGGAAWLAGAVGRSGFIGGLVLGTLIYTFGGAAAFLVLLAFFIMGSVTTRIGYAKKAAAGIAQEKGGARGAKNALANCTAGLLFAFFAAATPHFTLFAVALTAAFATAAFDTVSSEIGQVFGRRTVLITSLRPVPPGTEGAVSLEGTVAGALASLVVGVLAVGLDLVPAAALAPVAIGAFVGAMGESYLGATLESLQVVDNEMVNFLNTVAGGAVALALVPFFL